jgi:hypothetical protein
MSYPRQNSVGSRLHRESVSALDSLGEKGLNELGAIWRQHRKEMQLAIVNAHNIASRGAGNWNLATFNAVAKPRLENELGIVLDKFRALTTHTFKKSLNALYGQSLMRYAWILDQLTPPSRNVMIPHRNKLHEAAVVGTFYGVQDQAEWADKWDLWVKSYKSALIDNLAFGASNESPISEAIAEIDVTAANTPKSTLLNAMIRLYEFAAVEAIAEGENTIGEMNGDMVEVEIWKTRGDLNVCDQCAGNEGLPLEDCDGEIPAHPNCHCYSQIVPREYADLLASGDEDDRALARDMDKQGIVPNALVIRNDDGQVAAKTIVTFNQWTKGNGVSGGVQ